MTSRTDSYGREPQAIDIQLENYWNRGGNTMIMKQYIKYSSISTNAFQMLLIYGIPIHLVYLFLQI